MSRELRAALAEVLADVEGRDIAPSVRRLIADYRSGAVPTGPILDDPAAATAYAAYRMPATYAALREVFAQVPQHEHLRPRTMLDLGGGTGAAAWAARQTWPDLAAVTVTDQSVAALALGRRLAATAAAMRDVQWRSLPLGRSSVLEPADLITAAYLLGELNPPTRDRIVAQLGGAGRVVVVVEPGTPAGYQRVLVARDTLIAAGLDILAPCPHARACPLAGGRDWCHFVTRLDRSALHRQAKGGTLGHEDEKFAYVVAVRGTGAGARPEAADGRVLRHPATRKGLVTLTVCTRVDGVVRTPVPKSLPLYRAARAAHWGSPWPPADPP